MTILGSAHYYVWLRFIHAPDLPAPWHGLATVLLVLLAPMFPIASIGTRRLSRAAAAPILWFAHTWFGLAVYLLLASAATSIVCAVSPVGPREAALVAFVTVLATVVYGMFHARRTIVRRVRVPLSKLPQRASGYTIVQLTDIHIGAILRETFASKIVDMVNALAPDLIVLTGDLVDGHVAELRESVEPLRRLHARDGVFSVTGNHEYYWNADAWLDHQRSLGIRVLRNEHVTLGGAFTLAGVDDSTSGGMAAGHGEDIPGAIAGHDPALPIVLLAHHPSAITRAVAAGCDLQLSGHTHGGQLLPLGWLSRLFEPHVAGLARFGATWLYVSEGTGFWGPPLRVGTSSEIAHITLDRAQ